MFRPFKRETKGAVAVEFALILPLLLMLVCGIIEFGMLFRANLSVSQAARSGARTAVALPRVADYQTNTASAVAASLQNTLGADEITYLTIYKANKTTGLPTTGNYKTCTECYRFSWNSGTKTWTQLSGAAWLATSQKACGSEATTDYLGVYVEAKYHFVTGIFTPMFGKTSALKERTVMRLEPLGVLTSCA
jgi:Flp pilus assembly protein TadG